MDRLLDERGTRLRDEPGIGPIAAAPLLVEIGDPFRFPSESKFARGAGPELSPCHHAKEDLSNASLTSVGTNGSNSILYIESVTQQRHLAKRVIRRAWKDDKHRLAQSNPTSRLTEERLTDPRTALREGLNAWQVAMGANACNTVLVGRRFPG
jgi:transposase